MPDTSPERAARAVRSFFPPGRGPGPLLAALATLLCLCAPPCPIHAGDILSAHCPCGYRRDGLFAFAGRANFKTVCRFPARCASRGAVVLVDVMAPGPPASSECPGEAPTPYDAPGLSDDSDPTAVASWRPGGAGQARVLTRSGYLCPACGRFTLRFAGRGHWD